MGTTTLEDVLKPGQRIWVAGSSNEPTAVIEALKRSTLPDGLTFVQFPLPGYNGCDFTALRADARQETFFMAPALRSADPARLAFVPMQMRAVYDYLAPGGGGAVDVVLLQVGRGADGQLRLGPNVDFTEAALAGGALVIAELNHGFVAPAGCPLIDASRLQVIVESDRPLIEVAAPTIDQAASQIGVHVAGLIRDGDCIQTGIGAIPAAILGELHQFNDLGLHGGLIDEGGMALIRAGHATGANKPVDTGQHVAGMALGTSNLYDWLAETPEVRFRPANYTHEVSVIRELPQFVSVNSAVEVDLYGQVNAEFAGGRQLSGTGGSVDFMRGARASRGGRSIIAMTATARGGSVSRIVPRVELATALRTDIDLVVTEHGVARLDGHSVAERAEALIAIADPAFRDALRDSRPA